jgi:hypothetical protein
MTQPSLFDAEVLPRFEALRAEWLEEARAIARRLGADGSTLTVDDVRRLCPPPQGIDPRVMGALFTKSEWVCVGYRRSSRGICHNRPVGVFRLKDL